MKAKTIKQQVKFIMLSLMLVMGSSTAADALDSSNVNFGIFGAAALSADSDLNTAGYVAGRLTYDVSENVEVGVEAGWHEFEIDGDGDNLGGGVTVIDAGTIRGIPLMFIGSLKYPLEIADAKITPYVTGGLGVVFWDWNDFSATGVPSIDADGDASFTSRVGGGVEYEATENITVFTEGYYMWSDYDVSFAGTTVSETTEMDSAYVGGGLKFNF